MGGGHQTVSLRPWRQPAYPIGAGESDGESERPRQCSVGQQELVDWARPRHRVRRQFVVSATAYPSSPRMWRPFVTGQMLVVDGASWGWADVDWQPRVLPHE
jgi:hypothetical protein